MKFANGNAGGQEVPGLHWRKSVFQERERNSTSKRVAVRLLEGQGRLCSRQQRWEYAKRRQGNKDEQTIKKKLKEYRFVLCLFSCIQTRTWIAPRLDELV